MAGVTKPAPPPKPGHLKLGHGLSPDKNRQPNVDLKTRPSTTQVEAAYPPPPNDSNESGGADSGNIVQNNSKKIVPSPKPRPTPRKRISLEKPTTPVIRSSPTCKPLGEESQDSLNIINEDPNKCDNAKLPEPDRAEKKSARDTHKIFEDSRANESAKDTSVCSPSAPGDVTNTAVIVTPINSEVNTCGKDESLIDEVESTTPANNLKNSEKRHSLEAGRVKEGPLYHESKSENHVCSVKNNSISTGSGSEPIRPPRKNKLKKLKSIKMEASFQGEGHVASSEVPGGDVKTPLHNSSPGSCKTRNFPTRPQPPPKPKPKDSRTHQKTDINFPPVEVTLTSDKGNRLSRTRSYGEALENELPIADNKGFDRERLHSRSLENVNLEHKKDQNLNPNPHIQESSSCHAVFNLNSSISSDHTDSISKHSVPKVGPPVGVLDELNKKVHAQSHISSDVEIEHEYDDVVNVKKPAIDSPSGNPLPQPRRQRSKDSTTPEGSRVPVATPRHSSENRNDNTSAESPAAKPVRKAPPVPRFSTPPQSTKSSRSSRTDSLDKCVPSPEEYTVDGYDYPTVSQRGRNSSQRTSDYDSEYTYIDVPEHSGKDTELKKRHSSSSSAGKLGSSIKEAVFFKGKSKKKKRASSVFYYEIDDPQKKKDDSQISPQEYVNDNYVNQLIVSKAVSSDGSQLGGSKNVSPQIDRRITLGSDSCEGLADDRPTQSQVPGAEQIDDLGLEHIVPSPYSMDENEYILPGDSDEHELQADEHVNEVVSGSPVIRPRSEKLPTPGPDVNLHTHPVNRKVKSAGTDNEYSYTKTPFYHRQNDKTSSKHEPEADRSSCSSNDSDDYIYPESGDKPNNSEGEEAKEYVNKMPESNPQNKSEYVNSLTDSSADEDSELVRTLTDSVVEEEKQYVNDISESVDARQLAPGETSTVRLRACPSKVSSDSDSSSSRPSSWGAVRQSAREYIDMSREDLTSPSTSQLFSPDSASSNSVCRSASNVSGMSAVSVTSSVIDSDNQGDISDSKQESPSSVSARKEKEREKKRRKAFKIAEEIMISEQHFVEVLRLLNEDFRRGVVDMSTKIRKAIVPHNTLDQILKHLPQLQYFNENLLQDLTDRILNWDTNPRVADIFVKKGPFLKMYTDYIRDKESMVNTLEEAQKRYPDFNLFVESFEQHSKCGMLKLKHHMLKPIQRIPQYKLLLQDYKNHLDEESPDYSDTITALAIVSDVADHANESMKYGAVLAKFLEIQNSLIGQFEVIKPGRTFIKEGMLNKFSRKEMQPRMFYLFNDVLLYTTPVSGGFKLNNAMPLTGMKVSRPTKEDYQNEFSIITTQRSFTISASTSKERDEWLNALESSIKEMKDRRYSYDLKQHNITGIDWDKMDFKLGYKAPVWIPDVRVSMCQRCREEFTMTFRRHHCRACGKVVCSVCSDCRAPLRYLMYKPARVCIECYQQLHHDMRDLKETDEEKLSQFSKTNILAAFRRETWGSFGRGNNKRSRPAVLHEVRANEDDTDMSGYLKVWHVKSKRWKKKWFVVKDKVLYRYRASEDMAAEESLPLLGYEVRPFNTLDHNTSRMQKNSWFQGVESMLLLEIMHKNMPSMIFRTESQLTRDRWMLAMGNATIP